MQKLSIVVCSLANNTFRNILLTMLIWKMLATVFISSLPCLRTLCMGSLYPFTFLICISIHYQILWSKEFADAVFSDENTEGKTPLDLAVGRGHVK